jgi:hypothetical protein
MRLAPDNEVGTHRSEHPLKAIPRARAAPAPRAHRLAMHHVYEHAAPTLLRGRSSRPMNKPAAQAPGRPQRNAGPAQDDGCAGVPPEQLGSAAGRRPFTGRPVGGVSRNPNRFKTLSRIGQRFRSTHLALLLARNRSFLRADGVLLASFFLIFRSHRVPAAYGQFHPAVCSATLCRHQ